MLSGNSLHLLAESLHRRGKHNLKGHLVLVVSASKHMYDISGLKLFKSIEQIIIIRNIHVLNTNNDIPECNVSARILLQTN